MQGITRNPLADPFLLGVSSGAGLAAVSLIVWLKNVPMYILPWAAFAGALLTAVASAEDALRELATSHFD